MNQIDWSRVKKSPVPSSLGADVAQYFRGDGIKILVYSTGIRIEDADDNLLITRAGDYTDTPTGEIKKLAAAMLNRVAQKDERTDTWGTTREDVSMRVPTIRIDQSKAQPAFRSTFGFLTSGRTALA